MTRVRLPHRAAVEAATVYGHGEQPQQGEPAQLHLDAVLVQDAATAGVASEPDGQG